MTRPHELDPGPARRAGDLHAILREAAQGSSFAAQAGMTSLT